MSYTTGFPIPDKTVTDWTEIAPDIYMRWLYEGRVADIRLESVHREAIDNFVGLNRQLAESWVDKQSFMLIYDISHRDIAMTPYFRQALQGLGEAIEASRLRGHVMVIISNMLMLTIARGLQKIWRSAQSVKQHLARDYDEALQKIEGLLG